MCLLQSAKLCQTQLFHIQYTAFLTFFKHFSYDKQLLKLGLLLINFSNITLYAYAFSCFCKQHKIGCKMQQFKAVDGAYICNNAL